MKRNSETEDSDWSLSIEEMYLAKEQASTNPRASNKKSSTNNSNKIIKPTSKNGSENKSNEKKADQIVTRNTQAKTSIQTFASSTEPIVNLKFGIVMTLVIDI